LCAANTEWIVALRVVGMGLDDTRADAIDVALSIVWGRQFEMP